MQMKGNLNVNDDARLENEADVMGAKAVTTGPESGGYKALIVHELTLAAQQKGEKAPEGFESSENTAKTKSLAPRGSDGSLPLQRQAIVGPPYRQAIANTTEEKTINNDQRVFRFKDQQELLMII